VIPPLGESGQRALAVERAAREAAEAEIRAVRDEAQRHAEELAKAQTKAARADRLEVAFSKGLPLDLVDRLQGSTMDELSADADVLLALVRAS
jgi:hypothetical protein